jgi:hypothetical protein
MERNRASVQDEEGKDHPQCAAAHEVSLCPPDFLAATEGQRRINPVEEYSQRSRCYVASVGLILCL